VIGPEPPGVACAQCGDSSGTVYLIRNPFRGVRSEPLHEACAAAWFGKAGDRGDAGPAAKLVTDKAGLRPEAGPPPETGLRAGAETGPPLRLIESKRGPGRCAQCSDLRDGTETEFIIHGARVLLHKECLPFYTRLNDPGR
jgi:hypothetical protein